MNKTLSPILNEPSLMFLLNCFLSSIFLRLAIFAYYFLLLNSFSYYFSRSYFSFCYFCYLVYFRMARLLGLVGETTAGALFGTEIMGTTGLVAAGGTGFEFSSFMIFLLEMSSSLIYSSWSMFSSTYVLKMVRSLIKSWWLFQIFWVFPLSWIRQNFYFVLWWKTILHYFALRVRELSTSSPKAL